MSSVNNKMTESFNEIITKISSSPVITSLVISDKVNKYAIFSMILMTIFPLILKKFYDFIKQHFNNKKHSLSIPLRTDNYKQKSILKRLNYYLENNYDILNKSDAIAICDVKSNNDHPYFHNNKEYFPDNLKLETIYECEKISNDVKINYKNNELIIKICNRDIQEKNKKGEFKKSYVPHLYIEGNDISSIKQLLKDSCDYYLAKHLETSHSDKIYYRNLYCSEKRLLWNTNCINIKKTFENLFLPIQIKNNIKNYVDKFIKSEKDYKKKGIPYKLGFLLYGIPGTGKSSTIYTLSNYLKRDIYSINLDIINSYNDFYNKFSHISDSIVVIEDIDCTKTVKRRTKDKKKEKNIDITIKTSTEFFKEKLEEKLEEQFEEQQISKLKIMLEILDGYQYMNNCIIIFTTNHIDKLDPALIRPGRIDHKIELTFCDKEQINSIYNFFTNDKLDKKFLDKINCKITSSELINSIVLPNCDNPSYIKQILLEKSFNQIIT